MDMGTWGVGPFDDDTAMDFIDELMARSPVHVRSELDRVVRRIPESGEVDYTSALQAVAAAVLLGGCSLPPEIATWRRSLAIHVTAELAAAALLALERTHSPDSESWQLWCDAGRGHEVWQALADTVRELRAVVHSPVQTETLF
jgi:hypothetical protein